MTLDRRSMLKTTLAVGAIAAAPRALAGAERKGATAERKRPTAEELEAAANQPILKLGALRSPVKIASIELLRGKKDTYVRARSTDGVTGVAVTNSRAATLYPIFQKLVAPYFVGKDARDLEKLVDGVYVTKSNYKLAGLALWNCVAWVEFSLLDLLGRTAKQPVAELLGGVVRREIPMYCASGNRDTTPEQEADILLKSVEQTGCKAVKFKVGGRMSNNRDSLPGRTEGLIPLARKRLGDKIAIHADSNGSYDPPRAIEVGKMLEDIDAHFFEEPCPFDHYEDTLRVAEALTIPIAGGEQDTSRRRFRWMIERGMVRVVQPDLHYNGGLIRAIRVGRMAAAAGLKITPHMSGGGVGYVDVLHFAACMPNLGAYQEYKGSLAKTGQLYDPPLRFKDGAINIPTGPGLGIADPAALLKDAKPFAPA